MCVAATGMLAGENALSRMYKDLVQNAQESETEFRQKLTFQDFDEQALEVRRALRPSLISGLTCAW